MAITLAFSFLFSVVALGVSQPSAEMLISLIPANFTNRNLSSYTIRYLSNTSEDSEACLQPQPPQDLANSTLQSCGTIRYSLSGGKRSGRDFYNTSYLILVVSPGRYIYNGTTQLMDFSNIIIAKNPVEKGEVVFMCSGMNSEEYNNLYFVRAENIALLRMTFSNCGPLSPGIGFRETDNAVINGCTFKGNFNSGAHMLLSTNTLIQNSTFENNCAFSKYEERPGLNSSYNYGGGLSLLFVNGSDSYTEITDCTFRSNKAGINITNDKDAKDRPQVYVPRGHGGGLLISFKAAIGHRVMITNCDFLGNNARLTGGGISIQFYRGYANSASTSIDSTTSSNNIVEIQGSTFMENGSSGEGGAICVNTFEAANNNTVLIRDSVFHNNSAELGGGALSFNIQDNMLDEGSSTFRNIPMIEGCNFTNNSCPLGGSAIKLLSNARTTQITDSSVVMDCNFSGNAANLSALLSLRFPITLQGTNVFKENKGGAIILLQAQLYISGVAWFEKNSAQDGGAIKILDQSFLQLLEGANVTFLGNQARNHGGAMRVISEPLDNEIQHVQLYEGCFIRYSRNVNLSSWNASVSFIGNSAEQDGGAIYSTRLDACTNNIISEKEHESGYYYSNSIFQLQPPFQFSKNTVEDKDKKVPNISTEPSDIFVTLLKTSAAPGETVYYEVRAEGQSGNRQRALWTSNITGEGLFFSNAGGSTYNFEVKLQDPESINADNVCMEAPLETLTTQQLKFRLIQAVSGKMVDNITVDLDVTCCHPGYVIENNTCKHDRNIPILLRPDRNRTYFYIESAYCVNVTSNGTLIWASVPPFAGSCSRQDNMEGCLFKYDDVDAQCASNRTGFLCGQCPNNTNVDLTLSLCLDCKLWHGILILAIVVAFTVVCALIMIFNISVPNELRGFLFYIQVVGFVYSYSSSTVPWDYHLSSVFGFSLYLPLCPYPGFDTPTTAAFGIILPIIAIVMIVLYISCARFIKHLSNKNSFDGIWFLTFVIYKFVADTCFNILRCQKVYGRSPHEYVYYYNGEYECFSDHDGLYYFYTIVALFLSAAIVIFPVIILIISYRRFQLTLNMTDVLNKDLKMSCRWWASFDLFRRLLFVTVVLFFSYTWPSYTQLALLYSGFFVFFVFAISQPYTSRKANLSEILVLLDLLLVTALFLNESSFIKEALRPYGLVLLLLPFISAFIYLNYKIFAYMWSKFSPMSLKSGCVALLSKLMKRIGVRVPFLEDKFNCTSSKNPVGFTPLDEEEDGNNFADEDSDINQPYSQYREEILDD